MITPTERILSALDEHNCDPKQNGNGWSARCPAHEDRHPSLSVSEGDDGRALVHCHVGCTVDAICVAVGLRVMDLMPTADTLPTPTNDKRRIVATYDYSDERGELLYQVVRFEPKAFRQRRPDAAKSGCWVYSLGDVRRVLYRLPELLASDPVEVVFIVEGEKDADRLRSLGLVATTNAGGAGKWRAEYCDAMQGRTVVLLPDNDAPGRNHAQKLARMLDGFASSVRVVELPDLPDKGDVSDWLDARGTKDELMRLAGSQTTVASDLPILGIGALIAANPALANPVIDGILRRGETMNLIADPKRGKSWLGYGLALSVATGLDWFGRYSCEQGRVLIIDNELHPATLANRIPKVAHAMGIQESDYRPHLDVLPLRGRLTDLVGINRVLSNVERDRYALIVLDAFYRAIPVGVSENDNAQIAGIYNLLDHTASYLGCSWVNIHHATKGNQSGKSVADIGAGAGSQSRAADTHLVLRPHQEEGIAVLDAVVRSFAPVQPFAIRWDFPLWHPAMEYDPGKLDGLLTVRDKRQNAKDQEGSETILRSITDHGAATSRELRSRGIGIGADRCDRLLGILAREDRLTISDTIRRGNACKIYHLPGDMSWKTGHATKHQDA